MEPNFTKTGGLASEATKVLMNEPFSADSGFFLSATKFSTVLITNENPAPAIIGIYFHSASSAPVWPPAGAVFTIQKQADKLYIQKKTAPVKGTAFSGELDAENRADPG